MSVYKRLIQCYEKCEKRVLKLITRGGEYTKCQVIIVLVAGIAVCNIISPLAGVASVPVRPKSFSPAGRAKIGARVKTRHGEERNVCYASNRYAKFLRSER